MRGKRAPSFWSASPGTEGRVPLRARCRNMKQGAIPENPLEAASLATGLVPTPLLDTMLSLLLARTVLVAVKLGVFEALAAGPLPAAAVAERCGTDAAATAKLLTALAGARYLRFRAGRHALTS